MIRLIPRTLCGQLLLTVCAGSLVLTTPLRACIRLEWRASASVVDLDRDVDIGLYAVGVSDSPQDDPEDVFIAGDVFFAWDNAYLEFLSVEDPGNPGVAVSGLLCPDTLCLANETCPDSMPGPFPPPNDGDGLFQLRTELHQNLTATPEGFLLTTFRFRAVAITPAACIEIEAGLLPCSTRVFDEEVPNLDILCSDGMGQLCVEVTDIPCDPVSYAVQPTSDVVCEGATVTISAVAQGTDPLVYQWRREGVTIPGATSSTYILPDTVDTDTGNYDVVVSNECSSLVSDAATVLVWPIGTGDADGDGLIDGRDIPPFLHVAIFSPNGPPDLSFCAADLNHDGTVNLTDTQLLVGLLLAP